MKQITVRIVTLLLLGLSHPTGFYAQTTVRFSLQQAQDYAFENNYDLKNSRYDVDIARKIVKENTAIGLPQINAGLDYIDFIQRPTSLIPGEFFGKPGEDIPIQFGTKYNLTFEASASQLIYSGQYLIGLQTAKAYLEMAKQKNMKDIVDIRDEVANAYIRLLVNDENIKILDSTLSIVTRMVYEAQESYKNGLIEDVDVEQAELDQSNLEAQLLYMKNLRVISYNTLKFLIGISEEKEIELTDNLDYFLAQINKDALINKPFDYKYNIDYLLLKKQEHLTFMQFKLAKTAYQPSLVAFLGFSENAQRETWNFFASDKPWYTTFNWGASLAIPIWSSGSRKFKVDQARINVEKMKVEDEKARVALELQVQTAKEDFSNSFTVYQNMKKGFETSLKIYRKTALKYREGVATSTDLNQRYNQFLQANNNYMQSIFSLLSMKIRLTKLLEQY